MSSWYKKVEYVCECGHNYGSCGEIGKFFIKYYGVSDTYTILSQSHPNEPIQVLGWFDDTSLEALGKLLNSQHDDLDGCTPEEANLINEKVR